MFALFKNTIVLTSLDLVLQAFSIVTGGKFDMFFANSSKYKTSILYIPRIKVLLFGTLGSVGKVHWNQLVHWNKLVHWRLQSLPVFDYSKGAVQKFRHA